MADVKNNPHAALDAAHALSQPAEKYENHDEIELAWAMKAYEHADVHFNLITSVDPSRLRLCPLDDVIYTKFREEFPDFNLENVEEDELKSAKAKEKWRNFCNHYKEVVKDFNFGTLLRIDCTKGYNEENTLFATRVQFLAIEITRNRGGLNQNVFLETSKKKEAKKVETQTEQKLPSAHS